MTKKPPKKYQKAVDHASDLDRKYFKANPDAKSYVRDLIAGEFFPMLYPPDTQVRVYQVFPGVRQRQALSDDVTFHPDAAQYQHTPESIKQLLAEKPINSKKRMKRRRRG